MSQRKIMTTDEANDHLSKLKEQGVKVYDLRGIPQPERDQRIAEINDELSHLHMSMGQPFPCTFVAGSGKTNDPEVLAVASNFGKELQSVVTGGSQYSVMGEIAQAAHLKIGITCDMIMKFEPPDKRYDALIIADGEGFAGMEERLRIMRLVTQKELAVQGGMGTLEEILGGIDVREQLYVYTPYWDPMVTQLKTMHRYGYIAPAELDTVCTMCAKGNVGDALSQGAQLYDDAGKFRDSVTRFAKHTSALLRPRCHGNGAILDGSASLHDIVKDSAFFVLPPTSIKGMHQAVMVACEKRMDLMGSPDTPHPGIGKKPIVLLNVDGFYDEFLKQWQRMEQGGFLTEKLSDLFIEVKVSSQMRQPEIREVIAAAIPLQRRDKSGDVLTR